MAFTAIRGIVWIKSYLLKSCLWEANRFQMAIDKSVNRYTMLHLKPFKPL